MGFLFVFIYLNFYEIEEKLQNFKQENKIIRDDKYINMDTKKDIKEDYRNKNIIIVQNPRSSFKSIIPKDFN